MSRLSQARAEARRAYAAAAAKPAPAARTAILPQPTGQIKAALGYEQSVPRCETCRFVKPSRTVLREHTKTCPVLILPPVCKRGKFYTRDAAVCDHWTGHDGTTLDAGAA